jgi:hypothetical protein
MQLRAKQFYISYSELTGLNDVSAGCYTLLIKKTYVTYSGIEIEDSQIMDFGNKDAAYKFASKKYQTIVLGEYLTHRVTVVLTIFLSTTRFFL